ncbi:hypothetical protein, partial [Marichromatium sp. AB32]
MNVFNRDIDREPTRAEAERALALLRDWAGAASDGEIETLDPALSALCPGRAVSDYPTLSRTYPDGFEADAAYKASLPDLQ